MTSNLTARGIALTACLPLLAAAQAMQTEAPAAPPLRYSSAFADYKPYADPPLANWRAVNDTVAGASAGAAGGHGGHNMGSMKCMAMPAARAPAPNGAVPNKPPAAMPSHDGEHKPGGKP